MIRTTKEYVRGKIKEKMDPVAVPYGKTLVSDGAEAIDRSPMLNLLAVAPGVVEFIAAKDCTGCTKDAKYIADFVIDYIKSTKEPYLVRQVLMDNATRASWPLIEAACPWVMAGPCTPHCCDLLLEDFNKQMPWYDETIKDLNKIRKFIRNHQAIDAEFGKHRLCALGVPGETRFGTNVILADECEQNRKALETTILADDVKAFVERNKHRCTKPGKPTLRERYAEVKLLILGEDLWFRTTAVLGISMPVRCVLRTADGDGPTASKIHYMMFRAQEKAAEADLGFLGAAARQKMEKELIAKIICARWDYMFTDIMATGYLLDPEYWDMSGKTDDPEIMDGFRRMVDRTFPYPTTLGRNPSDQEKLKYEMEKEEADESRAKAEAHLNHYMSKLGAFGRQSALVNAKRMPACVWWRGYGSDIPELQKVACYALGQCAGAGTSERGHKEMNFLKSKTRNRLGNEKTEALIYIRMNMNQAEPGTED